MREIPRIGKESNAEEASGMLDSSPFGLGALDSEHGVVLKDWSAQDFANIYVRFRPNLVTYARKYFRDESQAEEVVQDAFLYLMTSLPELDSELGVLRFLKWKTKMLSFDLLRSTQGHSSKPLEISEDFADVRQPADMIERADDAAIVRMALAKLSPRQREALIATMYEEKTYQETARQMGLEENALRQLLFRARRAFKEALVGEADVRGKSLSEILTIASRRQATLARIAGSVGAVLVAGSLILLPTDVQTGLQMGTPQAGVHEFLLERRNDFDAPALSGRVEGMTYESELTPQISSDPPGNESVVAQPPTQEQRAVEIGSEVNVDLEARARLAERLDIDLVTELAANASFEQSLRVSDQTLTLASGRDLTAHVAFSFESDAIVQYLSIVYNSEMGLITAVPTNASNRVEILGDGSKLVSYVATDLVVGDLGGMFGNITVEDSRIRPSGVVLELHFSPNGEVLSAKFSILPRAIS